MERIDVLKELLIWATGKRMTQAEMDQAAQVALDLLDGSAQLSATNRLVLQDRLDQILGGQDA